MLLPFLGTISGGVSVVGFTSTSGGKTLTL